MGRPHITHGRIEKRMKNFCLRTSRHQTTFWFYVRREGNIVMNIKEIWQEGEVDGSGESL
jgi:hypothetical protein